MSEVNSEKAKEFYREFLYEEEGEAVLSSDDEKVKACAQLDLKKVRRVNAFQKKLLLQKNKEMLQ